MDVGEKMHMVRSVTTGEASVVVEGVENVDISKGTSPRKHEALLLQSFAQCQQIFAELPVGRRQVSRVYIWFSLVIHFELL